MTIALRFARSTLPSDRIVCVTVGSASGIAAIASDTALTNSASHAWPRSRPSTNMTIIVRPAAAAIHNVSVFISLVSGDCSFAVADNIAEIFPSSVSAPVPVTITVPLPCVTGVFMKTMFDWSPGPSSSPASVTASFPAGVLSPVSADSSICKRARGDDAAVGRHLIAGGEQDDVADDELLGRDLGLDPVAPHPGGRLHHRLERVHRALGLALLTQADDRVEHGQEHQQDAGAPLLDEQDTTAATTRMICM